MKQCLGLFRAVAGYAFSNDREYTNFLASPLRTRVQAARIHRSPNEAGLHIISCTTAIVTHALVRQEQRKMETNYTTPFPHNYNFKQNPKDSSKTKREFLSA